MSPGLFLCDTLPTRSHVCGLPLFRCLPGDSCVAFSLLEAMSVASLYSGVSRVILVWHSLYSKPCLWSPSVQVSPGLFLCGTLPTRSHVCGPQFRCLLSYSCVAHSLLEAMSVISLCSGVFGVILVSHSPYSKQCLCS